MILKNLDFNHPQKLRPSKIFMDIFFMDIYGTVNFENLLNPVSVSTKYEPYYLGFGFMRNF